MNVNSSLNSTNTPLVSVIVPAYNAEDYFDECLASIEGQTYRNIEIIVVDDGSTDSTLQLAQTHSEKDSRVTILVQDNQYAGVARNNGLEKAKGDYLLFFDADDILNSDTIELLVERAEETRADVTICRSTAFDIKSGVTYPLSHALCGVDLGSVISGKDLCDSLFQDFVGWPWDKLFRSSFVRYQDLRFQPLRTTNDAYFVYMALVLSKKISFVDYAGVVHRVGNSSSLEGSRRQSCENALTAAKTIFEALQEKGVYPSFERTYLNWLIHFSVWNIKTLDGDAREKYFSLFLEQLSSILPSHFPEGYFYDSQDAEIATVTLMTKRDLMKNAILSELSRADLGKKVSDLEKRISDLENERERIYDLWARDIERRNEDYEKEMREVLESKTFRVGKAVTAIPRLISKALNSH